MLPPPTHTHAPLGDRILTPTPQHTHARAHAHRRGAWLAQGGCQACISPRQACSLPADFNNSVHLFMRGLLAGEPGAQSDWSQASMCHNQTGRPARL